ncbi:hypothetical protein [Thiocystis violascens]|uniref:Uncharacterized protein n=1 Tax=Thiocystis violascens (strain ATCC 17096 / DSM 198 / 6111) TaxID=765911 RepID=I3Y5I4_THIV6|nr:hypothetical protein [Thiocystis violascens]AFL72252.1 hypothetical protein Thivi_0180 [Thiocystis violascens DSM 198]
MRGCIPGGRLCGAVGALSALLLLAGCATPLPAGEDPDSTRYTDPTVAQALEREGYYVALGDGMTLPERVFIYTSGEAAR